MLLPGRDTSGTHGWDVTTLSFKVILISFSRAVVKRKVLKLQQLTSLSSSNQLAKKKIFKSVIIVNFSPRQTTSFYVQAANRHTRLENVETPQPVRRVLDSPQDAVQGGGINDTFDNW